MNTIIDGSGDSAPEGNGGHIKDVDTATFMTEVIEASRQVPVIVDFWAPWCGPCKQLGPMLEKQVNAAGGKVQLAKVNIDENQQLAQQLRVQSIPMVYAFLDGQPVDGFSGAVPESQIKEFIDRLVQTAGNRPGAEGGGDTAADRIAQARDALAKGDEGAAMQLFSQVLEEDEKNVDAMAGLARCYVNAGEAEAAQALLDEIPEEHAGHADVLAVKSVMDLNAATAEAGDPAELAATVEAEPANHQARYDLALALLARGEREGAVEQLLELVRRGKDWNEQAARKQLVKMFEAWGPEDELTVEGRQRLSALLFA